MRTFFLTIAVAFSLLWWVPRSEAQTAPLQMAAEKCWSGAVPVQVNGAWYCSTFTGNTQTYLGTAINTMSGPAGSLYFANAYTGLTSHKPCTWDATHDVGDCVNNAIDAAARAGGGRILIPAGTYGLSTQITVGAGNIALQGSAAGYSGSGGAAAAGTAASVGTMLKWIGAAGGRMMSISTTSGQLLNDSVEHIIFNGNLGNAADGLYVASTFGLKLIAISFINGFNGGTILNLDVNASTGGNLQNSRIDNLYINNSSGAYTSDQLRLGQYIDNSAAGANASYNQFYNTFIAGQSGSTGILCKGCDNNTFYDTRIFNSGTSVDLSISVSANTTQVFSANGNTFDHISYNGTFVERGQTSFPACNAYTQPRPTKVCSYNNQIRNRDVTNGTPAPTSETGTEAVIDNTNEGYQSGLGFFGLTNKQPAFEASESTGTIGACRAAALTNGTISTSYLCNTSGGGLFQYDNLAGSRFQAKFAGSAAAATLKFEHLAGTGLYEFSDTVQADKGITLPANCTGLVSGALYNNAGTPAICP